ILRATRFAALDLVLLSPLHLAARELAHPGPEILLGARRQNVLTAGLGSRRRIHEPAAEHVEGSQPNLDHPRTPARPGGQRSDEIPLEGPGCGRRVEPDLGDDRAETRVPGRPANAQATPDHVATRALPPEAEKRIALPATRLVSRPSLAVEHDPTYGQQRVVPSRRCAAGVNLERQIGLGHLPTRRRTPSIARARPRRTASTPPSRSSGTAPKRVL